MNICFICPEYPDKNNIIKQNHIHNPVKALQRRGLNPFVVDLWPSENAVFSEIHDGVQVLRFGFLPRGLLRWKIYSYLWNRLLRTALESLVIGTDVFHIEFALTRLNPVLDVLKKRPMVITCHGDDVYPSKNGDVESARKRLLGAADKAIGVSEYTANLIRNYTGDRSKIIYLPNGVRTEVYEDVNKLSKTDAREKLGLGKEDAIILMACSLIERKGVVDVVEALQVLKQKGLSATLAVIGSGPEKDRKDKIATEKQRPPKKKYVDYVADDYEMATYYRACDVYTMMSKTVEHPHRAGVEGFGISYIDANAAGRPVVGGRSGGVENAVIDGVTGYLVDPYSADRVNDLAEKLYLLLTDKDLNEKMGIAGQKRVMTELTWDKHAEVLEGIYKEVAGISAIETYDRKDGRESQ